MKIILHAGTPKTGTTSLQLFLHTHHDALLDRGILYPRAGIAPPPEPKHQWMIGDLMSGDISHFTATLEAALSPVVGFYILGPRHTCGACGAFSP